MIRSSNVYEGSPTRQSTKHEGGATTLETNNSSKEKNALLIHSARIEMRVVFSVLIHGLVPEPKLHVNNGLKSATSNSDTAAKHDGLSS
jgi:hypothetical protein